MFAIPPIPSWDVLHPIVVHFPIALLLVAPLAVLASLVLIRHAIVLSWVALAVLAVGTAFAQLAVMTGEAAADSTSLSGAAHDMLEQHEETAEAVRTVYAVVTLLYAAVTGATLTAGRRSLLIGRAGGAVALIALIPASLMLVNAGHQGGRLVHEFGVRAVQLGVPGESPQVLAPDQNGDGPSRKTGEDDRDKPR